MVTPHTIFLIAIEATVCGSKKISHKTCLIKHYQLVQHKISHGDVYKYSLILFRFGNVVKRMMVEIYIMILPRDHNNTSLLCITWEINNLMTATWPHAHGYECVCINDLSLAQRDLFDVFQKMLSMIQQLNASLNIHAPQHMLRKILYGNADGNQSKLTFSAIEYHWPM